MLTTAQVTAIQQALKEAGFFYQDVTGSWDEHTTQGYRNFCATVLNQQNSRFIQQPHSWDVVPVELRGNFVQPEIHDELNAVNPDEIVQEPEAPVQEPATETEPEVPSPESVEQPEELEPAAEEEAAEDVEEEEE
mgnify:CR=1 FL=1|jgi:hypothetical protein